MMTAVAKDDPSHGAVCADDGDPRYFDKSDPGAHERQVLHCLKSAIRSAKLKAAKKRREMQR